MSVLIIGANGFTGRYLYQGLGAHYAVQGTSTSGQQHLYLDLSETSTIVPVLQRLCPRVICLPAALTNMQQVAASPAYAHRINVDAVAAIAHYAATEAVQLIYFSSEAVFDGRQGPYRESDATNPISIYGQQKYEAEQFVRALKNSTIIRMSHIYGWDARQLSFVSRLLGTLQKNMPMTVPAHIYCTPVYVADIVQVAAALIAKPYTGILHLGGPTLMNRYEMAQTVCQVFGLDNSLVMPQKDTTQTQASLPTQGGLISCQLQSVTGIVPRAFEHGVRCMKRYMKETHPLC